MKDKKIRKIGTILLLLTSFVGVALAQGEERSFQITPAVIEIELRPGTTETTQVSIKNLSADLVTLEAFVRDFVAAPDGDEPRILADTERSGFSLKDWILLSEKQLVLQPDEQRTVTVTIGVPQGAEPGGRYGLVGFTAPNTDIGQGVGVEAGIATLIFGTVAGDLALAASIDRFSAPSPTLKNEVPLTLVIQNRGNVHFQPTGTIRLTNLLGRTTAELPVNAKEGLVLPGSSRTFVADWKTGWAIGPYRVSATVNVGDSGTVLAATPITVWVLPMRTLSAAFVTLIILVLLVYEYEHIKAIRRAREKV